MPWPPPFASRRVALVLYGLALMAYLMLTAMFTLAGLDARVVVIAAQLVGILGVSIWLALLLKLPLAEAFSLRPAAPVHWLMVVAAALPLQIAGGALQFVILVRTPEDSLWRRAMEQLDDFVRVDTTRDFLLLFGAAVLTAAVCEEFLFRGLLLQLLRRRSGWIVGIGSSAVLFAVFHLNPVVLAPVGLVGAYLAVLVWRSGSLYPAIMAHALNNGLALFASQIFAAEEQVYEHRVMWTLALSCTVFLFMLIAYLRITEAPKDDASPAPAARRPGGLEGLEVDGGLGHREQAEDAEQAE